MTLKVKVKGSAKSGNYGHMGRPGLEGGSIPKGGRRRVYGTGKRVQSFPKPMKIPTIPLSGHKISNIPEHTKGDKTGAKAYAQWKKTTSGRNVSDKDDATMRQWFADRAKAMEHNLAIPTVVPGQRDDEDEEKKKPEEKKAEEPEEGKGKKKGKVTAKKPKAGKAPKAAKKPKVTVKKPKGISDEARNKILSAVKVKPEVYNALRKAEQALKAGDMPDWKTVLLPLLKAGYLNIKFGKGTDMSMLAAIHKGLTPPKGVIEKLTLKPYGRSLIKAVEGGDAIRAQEVLDRASGNKALKVKVRP